MGTTCVSPGGRGGEGRSVASRLQLAAPLLLLLVLLAVVACAEAAIVGKSLYDELGVLYNVTTDEIVIAYERHSQTWRADRLYEPAQIRRIIEIEHAYHVLSNNLTRRDYDYFQIDQLEADVAKVWKQYDGKPRPQYVEFPLWKPENLGENIPSIAETVTSANFGELVLFSQQMWVLQIYSVVSPESHEFAPVWERTVELLDGVVRVGRLELGEVPLTILIAERHWLRGHAFFRNGLPAIIIVHPGCDKLGCIIRYYGGKTSVEITDWVASRVLKLPRILYYSGSTLVPQFMRKYPDHKVKVIQFSTTGERASLQLRKCAKDEWQYVAFAMVLWRKSEADYWEQRVGVKEGPATVFFKDPGLPPVIHHGKLTSSEFLQLLDQHKTFELPQLRTISAASLGCDASSPSLAGNDTKIWYCVVVAGRHSINFAKMRGVLRDVQSKMIDAGVEEKALKPSVQAYKEKRLSFAWLDGETQKSFCYFYLHAETLYEACGPKKPEYEDIPKMFLIRYYKEFSVEQKKATWRPKTQMEKDSEEQQKFAAQLVTRYTGSADSDEVIDWISSMVTQGDEDQLAGFRGKPPGLVPEEHIPYTAKTQEFIAEQREGMLETWRGIQRAFADFKEDPKFLPLVMAIVGLYSIAYCLRQNQKAHDRKEKRAIERLNDERASGHLDSPPASDVIPDQNITDSSSATTDGLRRREPFQSS